jgi:thiol-disulfide isomerase/thioredoxin
MVMIYFGSKTCSVCKSMMPKVENMIKRYPNIYAIMVEADKSLDISSKFNVFTVPVILLYIEGKETIREVRIISLDNLEQKNCKVLPDILCSLISIFSMVNHII